MFGPATSTTRCPAESFIARSLSQKAAEGNDGCGGAGFRACFDLKGRTTRPKLGGQFGDGGEERLRIRMRRTLENLLDGTDFDEAAGLHHGHARGDLRDNRQAV